jgi:hypothetical protein
MQRRPSPEVGVSVRGFSEGHEAIITAKEVTGMLGSAARRVACLARTTTTVVGLAIMLALVLGVASTALAGTGVGATLNLGKINTADAVSRLVGSVAGPSLKVDNNSAGASATALDLQVEPGRAPMKVPTGWTSP